MRFFRLNAATLTLWAVLAFLFATPFSQQTAYGQDVAGMTGTVVDQSGAAVPNVTVTLKNESNGFKTTVTTTTVGFYRFTNIPPGGGFEATFSAKGFATLEIKSIYLTVASIRTQNATLKVGATTEAIEVSASSSLITLDTTDATVGNDIPVQAINNLPVQQRADPTSLFTLQAGVTVEGSVAGARTDQNYITLDGLDVNDISTGNAVQNNSGVSQGFENGIVGHAPVDSVEQFHAGVAGNTADTGAAGGGQFALVTKGGTNKFHGDLNEYHRDPSLVANSWFSNNATPKIPRNHLIQNQFGGSVGGPITIPHLFSGKDKAFFFFDYNNSRIIESGVVNRIVPLDSFRAGNISYCTSADCSTVNTMSPDQVKAMDPTGAGELGTWFGQDTSLVNTRIKFHSNNTAVGDGVNSGGYIFNAPNNDNLKNFVGRIDYNINDKMKLYGRFTIAREVAVNALNAWPGDPITSPFVDRTYAVVIGHSWVIGNNKTNRVYLGETVEKYGFPNNYAPMGANGYTFADGADQSMTSNLYTWPGSQSRRIPLPVLGDDFSLTKANHTWQWGGTFKNILAHNSVVSDDNIAQIGLGGHVLGLCTSCGTGNPSLRPADIDPSQTLLWDEAFAYALGRIGNVQSTYNYDKSGTALKQLTGDQRDYRYYQLQLYALDTWKLTPSLTVNYGLNYQWFSVPYETHGFETVEPYTFKEYFGARVLQSQLGQSGADAVPLISYLLGGKGNGSGAPGLYPPEYRNFAPHVGFDWNPGFDKKMVINGGASIVYDRTVIMAVQSLQDGYSYLFQQSKTLSNGDSTDPYTSIATDPRLDSTNGLSNMALSAPSTPTPPYQPYVDQSYCTSLNPLYVAPCGLQDGGAFNSATIDPGLKTPYNIVFNLGVQRNLPWNMILKASYVGRLGRRLLGQADAEQIIDFPDTQSGQLFSDAFGQVVTQIRQGVDPLSVTAQPWFEHVYAPGRGIAHGFASNTNYLAAALGWAFQNGDFADFNQAISGHTPLNVGMAAQFSENSFYTNDGFSNYHGLLATLSKNLTHGLQFDFNYTWSHSIDNISFFANSQGDTGIGSGIGLICDVVRPRECRSRSDFDMRHLISSDATYQLPFGKGRMFLATQSHWVDEIIGAWDLSGVASFHTGEPWSTTSNAFVASYSNDAPAIFVGSNASVIKNHVTKIPGGGVSDFSDATTAAGSFEGPIGFKIGPRNQMTGPRFFNADMGLAKTFPVYKEAVNFKFRADAFNVLNHPNFALPLENVYNGYDETDYMRGAGFGNIHSTISPPGNLNNGARVLQVSLRLEF
jgi:hypothetical protein